MISSLFFRLDLRFVIWSVRWSVFSSWYLTKWPECLSQRHFQISPLDFPTEKNRELGPESVGLTVRWCDCKRTVKTKYNDVYGIGMAGMVLYTEWWEWVTVSCIWQIAGCFLVPGASRQRCDMTTLPSRADLDVTACQDRGYPKTGRSPCPPWPSMIHWWYLQTSTFEKTET